MRIAGCHCFLQCHHPKALECDVISVCRECFVLSWYLQLEPWQAAKAADSLEPALLKWRRMCLYRPVAQQKEPKWLIVYGILVICVVCISLARALAFFEATFRLTILTCEALMAELRVCNMPCLMQCRTCQKALSFCRPAPCKPIGLAVQQVSSTEVQLPSAERQR